MGLNFKISFVMVVMIWQCYVEILVVLLLLQLKVLIIVVFFMILINQLVENFALDNCGYT